MSGSDENGSPGLPNKPEEPQQTEHLNIKVTDNNNEVFFKIKRTTQLKKLMDAFCERQGKAASSVRFLFDGSRVQPTDSPDTVRRSLHPIHSFISAVNRVKSRVTPPHCRNPAHPTITDLPFPARDAGRRHPRGPPGADWRRKLRQPTSLCGWTALGPGYKSERGGRSGLSCAFTRGAFWLVTRTREY